MGSIAAEPDVENAVRRAIVSVSRELGFELEQVHPHTSLIDDIGLDSLKFVDLTLAIEEALSLRSFPMQEWVDVEQRLSPPNRFTVGSLVNACARALALQAE